LTELLEQMPEYSGDWGAFIGNKLNDERHRNKWFRIGWNQSRSHMTAVIKEKLESLKGEQ